VNVIGNLITAVVALLGVGLGGWLTLRSQDRSWHREHTRQWRDIRLSAYRDFLTAYREYISFALEPSAQISARPHPRRPATLMPIFDDKGTPYRKKLEAATGAAKLVVEAHATILSIDDLVIRARDVAAARASNDAGEIPTEYFERLWAAERAFRAAARNELGLPAIANDVT
jgi:hypothetical protein